MKYISSCLIASIIFSTNSITFAQSTSSINLSACYSTAAKRGASSFDGRVAVGVLCKQKTDILINDQVTTNDPSGARPVIERKRLVINNKLPNGVEYGMISSSGNKKFYEVQVGAFCCPLITTTTSDKK